MQKIASLVLTLVLASLVFTANVSVRRADGTRHHSEIASSIERTIVPFTPGRRQEVLFVEDPGDTGFGSPIKPDPTWRAILDAILGVSNYGWFGPTLAPEELGPDLATMQGYGMVIWNCYDYWWDSVTGFPHALNDEDVLNLGLYMDGGGKVWLIGHDIIYSGVSIPDFLTPYFHIESVIVDYAEVDSVNLHGLAEVHCHSFFSTADYTWNPFFLDALTPDANAHAFLEDTDNNQNVGIFYPGLGDWVSAFQAVDGRTPYPWMEWQAIVGGMLGAFLGVAEFPISKPALALQVSITPVPFNRFTTISYSIPVAANVTLQVFDKLGSRVTTLIDDYKSAGTYHISWNGKDSKGVNVSNGVYFLRLTCGEEMYTRNLVVVR